MDDRDKNIINAILGIMAIFTIIIVSSTLISLRSTEVTVENNVVEYEMIDPIVINVKIGSPCLIDGKNYSNGDIIPLTLDQPREIYLYIELGMSIPEIEVANNKWINLLAEGGISANYMTKIGITIINDTLLNKVDHYYSAVSAGMEIITCNYPQNLTGNCQVYSLHPNMIVTIINKRLTYDLTGLFVSVTGVISFIATAATLLGRIIGIMFRCIRRKKGNNGKVVEMGTV